MVKDILSLGIKNLVAIPLLGVQSQLIGSAGIPAGSQAILRAGVAVQAGALLGENVKVAKKKIKGF